MEMLTSPRGDKHELCNAYLCMLNIVALYQYIVLLYIVTLHIVTLTKVHLRSCQVLCIKYCKSCLVQKSLFVKVVLSLQATRCNRMVANYLLW